MTGKKSKCGEKGGTTHVFERNNPSGLAGWRDAMKVVRLRRCGDVEMWMKATVEGKKPPF